ncbi:hypothetical protein N7499_003001 [Penicillium canescens]|uniref:Extracellular membrane protein CFEM domain-containing protein n=1 Tax=Penicillium canescens TaxID=5083 RepID=A0AAD6IBN4_PENCN|nr:uncharacterized protein N7446_011883 [Penicillium canescens]XP_058368406.1 uncharacterized protein N7446_010825 [Penicillium canescens]KAJ6019870.1 hypothetical protein N7522_000578 [Penicillium canescens]KAJ6039179.1 hypothetical protein N7460_007211 [Penicillium canescens]KAJ6041284.1 hypothetical protein N7460_006674 [Penicillium canescens]KAJ6047049.1 hypothetical protein N7446_011883 [Penicillium canescens]KAJ6050716.1 hypothetical protein N7446_010825 [Penicillium canescens]
MRFLIPLSVLLVSTLASPNDFNDILGEIYGDCGGACASTEFKDSKADCGDPSSSASNACFCKNYVNIFSDVDMTRFGTCISGCNLDISNLDYSKLAQNVGNICGSNLGVDTTDNGALPSNTASSSTGGPGSTSTAVASSPSHTGAASTIASSKTALILGALAFFCYAL